MSRVNSLGLTLDQRNNLADRYRQLLNKISCWPDELLYAIPHLHYFEDLVSHNLLSTKVLKLAAELVILLEATPSSEVTLPAEVQKRVDDISSSLVTYFEMGRYTHKLELKDIRPSTLPDDPELLGK